MRAPAGRVAALVNSYHPQENYHYVVPLVVVEVRARRRPEALARRGVRGVLQVLWIARRESSNKVQGVFESCW